MQKKCVPRFLFCFPSSESNIVPSSAVYVLLAIEMVISYLVKESHDWKSAKKSISKQLLCKIVWCFGSVYTSADAGDRL